MEEVWVWVDHGDQQDAWRPEVIQWTSTPKTLHLHTCTASSPTPTTSTTASRTSPRRSLQELTWKNSWSRCSGSSSTRKSWSSCCCCTSTTHHNKKSRFKNLDLFSSCWLTYLLLVVVAWLISGTLFFFVCSCGWCTWYSLAVVPGLNFCVVVWT